MGNCFGLPTTALETKFLTIESSSFKLPSPLPSWPSGVGFANGIIDLGGLEVCQVSTFTKVWATHEGGQDNSGATFFVPSPIPTGFSLLGCYAQPNNRPLFGWVLVGRDTCSEGTLAKPVDYTLLWNSESSNFKQDGNGYFWLPTPPEGYKAVGLVVTNSSEKPSLDDVRCVRLDLTDACENDESIWDKDGFSVHGLRPATRGIQALGVWVGTFIAQANGSPGSSTIACLKNKDSNFNSMPNLSQIQAIMQAYSPWIYFHPDEEFLPSSVSWFFDNGALLYEKGNPSPAPITSNGSNLPQGGSNDGAYWIDLPVDDREKDKVKKGDIPSSKVYLHVKPMLGATFTDVAIWIFYPFNGPAKAKVGPFNLSLGRIGEHVGDWEHVTLRVSNFSGELWRVYFSEHSAGTWVEASQLEFEGGNKPVVYSSLHGHANYSKAGLVLEGNSTSGIGIRNDTAKGKNRIDSGERFEVAAAEYLVSVVTEPPWIDYEREWGPKITYDIGKEISRVARLLPGRLKTALRKLVERLPDEVLGEEGPTGPKVKSNWYMDER
ncbi:vacuolar protein sorting-associated protein 62 [Cocos nucifera]|uniref:Vacuolar protein sorting-associated protein 62 n=1 Tax=Cocos nucifera TaxID=13894 RepID=A0A8K0ND12_COCNU|nr:vacuolar protein sorting-associated protein 62 [Cocos nucifera]